MRAKERTVTPDITTGDNQNMDRQLTTESVEGEIALVIDYVAGESSALDVLGGAMALVQSIDGLDRALLSSLGGELEPVSILNDVQHSSLKLLLARALRKVPDEHIKNPDWKKWVGSLLVQGKHRLLQNLEADAPAIEAELKALEPLYHQSPELIGRTPPSVASIQTALQDVRLARAQFGTQNVLVQTELGDIALGFVPAQAPNLEPAAVAESITNKLRERLKVRFPDMHWKCTMDSDARGSCRSRGGAA